MVTIRRGTAADAPAVVAFGQLVLPATYDPISTAYTLRTLARYWEQDYLRGTLDRIPWLLAFDEDRVLVGVATLGELDGLPMIWMLYVRPDHQGSGLGRRLLDGVLALAPPTAKQVRLSHVAGNERAASFYAHRGFVEVDQEPPRDGTPGEVWLSLSLET